MEQNLKKNKRLELKVVQHLKNTNDEMDDIEVKETNRRIHIILMIIY
jgi:hypothetical protein